MFQLFSAAHVAALLAAILLCAAVPIYRSKLRDAKAGRIFRRGLAALLVACEISLQVSLYLDDGWQVSSLPFQLCSLTLLVSAAALVSRSKRLYPIVFFLGTLGALQALLTPNLAESFPEFRYFHFFIAHIGIVMTAFYIFAVERYRPTFVSVLGAMAWLHVLAIPAAIVNIATGTTNFMFLARKPSTASLLDALAPWPWYLLQLEAVALLMCLLLFGLSRLAAKAGRKSMSA
ncbi:TIGR02206 family membrane protein [Paenibacillus sp. LHD-117]|uniref:YwaF family protein n=1 Tax=Paenibacillus sp. LHD-117 TaxID=3071412 RepID=UPI0027E1290E|nr:TIGR02206 family membrane protein [Paenibacillus sp. LHD-117]MDQ6418999.1 TIGR02206 family membrane protein [Paenibacillus sp. LHD-117]